MEKNSRIKKFFFFFFFSKKFPLFIEWPSYLLANIVFVFIP